MSVNEGTDRRRCPQGQSPSGGAVYGLGTIGALVWYWKRAEGPGQHAVGVLKSFVWPAFLVYHAFEKLDS
jgi:hypothetical protein